MRMHADAGEEGREDGHAETEPEVEVSVCVCVCVCFRTKTRQPGSASKSHGLGACMQMQRVVVRGILAGDRDDAVYRVVVCVGAGPGRVAWTLCAPCPCRHARTDALHLHASKWNPRARVDRLDGVFLAATELPAPMESLECPDHAHALTHTLT
jgi:hypothetical protein